MQVSSVSDCPSPGVSFFVVWRLSFGLGLLAVVAVVAFGLVGGMESGWEVKSKRRCPLLCSQAHVCKVTNVLVNECVDG